jgi:transcriptional regulator with XRE-family HTH domain
MPTFGENLRILRLRRGLSLKDLAMKLDVSINYLSKLENNQGKIKPEFLPKLCEVLEIEIINELYED